MNKILVINTVPTERNGITGVIFNYLNAIERGGLRMDLLSLNEPNSVYIKQVEERGGKVYVLPRRGNRIFRYWNGLRILVSENHYDIVHVHGNSHTIVLELTAIKAAGGAKCIVHAHSTSCSHMLLHHLLSPIFSVLCDYGLACGAKAGYFMFGKSRFVIINNGVDVERYRFNPMNRKKTRNLLNITEGECLLGHVGYFQDIKNQRFIVEIMRHLDSQFKLVLIGDGPQRKEVKERVIEYGLSDRVIFTGSITNVESYLSAIDLIIMPSLFEGVPLTLIEQQASGLNCVVSDTITREADKTGNVTFVPLSDGPEKWASIIKKMPVETERTKISEEAIGRIETTGYSIQREANKLLDFYHSI